MTLTSGQRHQKYLVSHIETIDAVRHRLLSLGMTEGAQMELLNRKRNGTLIVKVRGTRWALGQEIAQGIHVKEQSGT